MYKYKAKVINVVDGDTIDAIVDLGFKLKWETRLRLYGIDTPETRTKNLDEKKKGLEAKEYVKSKIEGKEVLIETHKKGKFGRYLATIFIDGINLNLELIKKGLAREYYGD